MDQRSAKRRDRRAGIGPVTAAMLATSMMATGCQGMGMSTQNSGTQASKRADNTVADWPLKFVQHNFGTACYSTYGCRIRYAGYSRVDPDDELGISSESLGAKYPKNLSAGYLGILGVPQKAQLEWRSKDGVPHKAVVDLGEIFKDQLILHNVPREDIPEGISILNPGIILEINDRTVNVYMRAFIPTKELQEPGNPHSGHRRDLLLAWSKTF